MHVDSPKNRWAFALAGVLAAPAVLAATWYADAAKYESSGDGTRAATAFGTIQEAIDAAAADDTIYVLPGVYDKGSRRSESAEGDSLTRVLVTKPLRIISTEGAAATHIVGAPDPATKDHPVHEGRGPNAVRCVRFELAAGEGAATSLLQGFTIRDGYCGQQYAVNPDGSKGGAGADIPAGNPGCVAMPNACRQNIYVTDSEIFNGYGVRGGNARNGCYVRCRFRPGFGDNGMGRDLYCVGCLFERASASLMSCQLLNCVIVDAPGGYPLMRVGGNSGLYNTILAHCSPTPPSGGISEEHTLGSLHSSLPYPVNSDEDACLYGAARPFFAPLRGDFHLRTGVAEATLASRTVFEDFCVKYLGRASRVGVDIRKDFDGNEFATSDAYPAGCYVTVKTPAGGCVAFINRRVVCDGYEAGGDRSTAMYAYSETPRETIRVTPPAGVAYFSYAPGADQGGIQYPEMDESLYVALPPAGVVLTNEPKIVESELYVSAEDGNDETGDGSAAAPYRTLAKAATEAPKGLRVLIHAAAGDYKDETMTEQDCQWRVSLVGKAIRLKGAGRGRSFITGAPDPDTDAHQLDRRGPKAVRCVVMDGGTASCVQGFTIRNGYSDVGEGNDYLRKGALVCVLTVTSSRCQCVDCELEGGQAFRGGQAWYGVFTRCIFHGWRLTTIGHAIRYGDLRSCIFYDNQISGSGSIDSSALYQCTLVTTNNFSTHIGTCTLDGCITYAATGNNAIQQAGGVTRCFYTLLGSGRYVANSEPLGDDVARKVEQGFADVAGGDFRLRTSSSVFANLYEGVDANYWKLPVTDVHGVPFDFVHGNVPPGAVQTPAQVVVGVESAYGGYPQGGGTNILSAGESVTITFVGNGTRRLDGLLVNGESQNGLTYSYTCPSLYDESGRVVPPVFVSPILATNWYVNAVSGNDDNDGCTPETAWRTLERINTSGVVWEGDLVHAAPGDYADGRHESATQGNSRFYLPGKVTLVADEGPEVTRILGEKSTGDGSDANGRGPGALRCAELASGAVLKRFTLTGGRTVGTDTAESNMNCGGGVLADGGTAYGCVITNCVAGRGGAARYGRLVNCRLLDNNATACTPTGYETELVGCYVDGCRQAEWCRRATRVYRCTFGTHNNVAGYGDPFDQVEAVVDCVVMVSSKAGSALVTAPFSGCVFVTNAVWTADLIAANTTNCRWVDAVEELGLDAEGRPAAKTSLVVDAGSDDVPAAAQAWLGGVDVQSLPRISNGRIDLGAYEYDWRPVYARDLGLRSDAVVSADEQVVEGAAGTVNVPAGTVTLRLVGAAATRVTYDVPVLVTGTGTLTATLNDEPLATFTADDGAKTLSFQATSDVNSLVFAYAPGADDAGCAQLSALVRHMKGSMFYFR